MTDIFDKCRTWPDYRAASREGTYPYYRPISSRHGTEVVMDGHHLIMAGSNDYLGLSVDGRLAEAARRATDRYGTTCSGSRLLNGTMDLHEELEHRLAAHFGFGAALVAATGFQTNLALAALLGRGDVVYADRGNHASLVDAVRLGFARHRRYPHLDLSHLERLLAASPEGGRLIVTDGLFSMEGDLCDLPALVKLARLHGARIAVDSAHDAGLLGATGRGVIEHFGVDGEVDLMTATFSKCFGSVGGVIAAEADVISYLRHFARSLVYSAGLSPASTAAALAALDIVQGEPERRERVLHLAERMRDGLRAAGFRVGSSATPVIPVYIDGEALCFRFWTELFHNGVFTNAVIPPAAPPGRPLIRTTLTALHTDAQLDRILDAFTRAGRKTGVL